VSVTVYARAFTFVDEVEMSHFGDPNNGQVEPITFSPDRQYFAVHSERGVVGTNRSESRIRVYATDDVSYFLSHPAINEAPPPAWEFSSSTYKDGPIITQVRWLPDSSAFAFLEKKPSGCEQLVLGDVKDKTRTVLTGDDQAVLQYDIKDRTHFVYITVSPAIRDAVARQQSTIGLVGTGRSLMSLMFPQDTTYGELFPWADLGELWAVRDGKRVLVRDVASGKPLPIHWAGETLFGEGSLALSPDGRFVVAIISVRDIPPDWKILYPPPDPKSAIQIRTTGAQDIWALDGFLDVSEYVVIDLETGSLRSVTNAPTGYSSSNWGGAETAVWSRDGRSILLSNTFVPPTGSSAAKKPSPPCVTLIDVASGKMICLERHQGSTYKKESQKYIETATFAADRNDAVRIGYWQAGTEGSLFYVRSHDGTWMASPDLAPAVGSERSLDVTIKQDLNSPPVLFATDPATKVGRVLWDPNPQLKEVEFGKVSTLEWKDETGRAWEGGLYKPRGYVSGHRYPLVVQTHGFQKHEFRPSGNWPTGFAAQQLSAAGFLVLQVPDCPMFETPQEGPCNIAGYEAGATKLISVGMADPDRLGIIGFSRTCFSVMTQLTRGHLHFEAASITEGFIMGYMEYLQEVDYGNDFDAHTVEAALGARKPFGQEIYKWISRSPEFNIHKVTTPLQIVATNNHYSLLELWEPYAALRFLKKPVDLIILQEGTHPLSNPGQIMASQQNTVDWFRFWLQDYEDPDPLQSDQYKRWREMRRLRDAQLSATR